MLETSQKFSRFQKLKLVLRSYLSSTDYNRLLRKINTWEPESLWEKMRVEINALNIPKDPTNEKCVQIYAYLFDQDFKTTKARMLTSTPNTLT